MKKIETVVKVTDSHPGGWGLIPSKSCSSLSFLKQRLITALHAFWSAFKLPDNSWASLDCYWTATLNDTYILYLLCYLHVFAIFSFKFNWQWIYMSMGKCSCNLQIRNNILHFYIVHWSLFLTSHATNSILF